MTAHRRAATEVAYYTPEELAKQLLAEGGYVVVKAKSYRAAQERQRLAEVLRTVELERRESAERWARDCLAEERRLRDRLTLVFGFLTEQGRDALLKHDRSEIVA